MGTFSLLEACRTVSCADRFIFASSGAYYGTTTTEACLCESDVPLTATNIYAPSKSAGDLVVRCYARIYGLKAATCRFMNTYGPGDTNFSRLVPRAARNLIEGRDYDFGDRDDGTSRLDFLYIKDMSAAYVHVAEHLDEVAGQAFNFGAGTPTSVTEVAKTASTAYDGQEREPVFRREPFEEKICKSLNIARAEEVLGWKPSTPLKEGMRETMSWYRANWSRIQ
jgi:CDP-glucose 4,6-dehydratase